jgi:hypothetical protein
VAQRRPAFQPAGFGHERVLWGAAFTRPGTPFLRVRQGSGFAPLECSHQLPGHGTVNVECDAEVWASVQEQHDTLPNTT